MSDTTKRQKVEHKTQCYEFDFTFFGKGDWLPTPEEFVALLRPIFKKWGFQKEACPTTGTYHYQGRGSLYKKKRQPELCSMLNETSLRGMDVSESSGDSRTNECFYMFKLDTRLEGPWTDKTWTAPAYIPRQYRGLMERLWPWQKYVHDSRDDFNDRLVNCIVDTGGCKGKSTCARLALKLPVVNDHKELLQATCDILMAQENREPGLCFVDLPRSLTTDPKKFGPFMIAIEEIKGGCVADLRFHYKEWWFDSPAVWVFCNHVPNTQHMSEDRWRFWTIDHFKNLKPLTKDEMSQMSQPPQE